MKAILENERKKSNINPEELAWYLYGSEARFERVKSVSKKLVEILGPNNPGIFEMSRDQLYTDVQEKTYKLRKAMQPGIHEQADPCPELFSVLNFQIPGSIGLSICIQTIKILGTDWQKEKWLPQILNNVWFPCYAQSELSVGSDSQGIRTLAVYNEESESFVIHSPDTESIKWWQGDNGLTATHAIVVARLVVKGKDLGIQSFFVEIRNPETHVPHPGVEIGDLGPKLGLNSRDHGYIRFDQFRVPKSQLLSQFISQDKEGQFKVLGSQKIVYAGMMHMRGAIVVASYCSLFKAVTIATRFAVFRTQFKNTVGSPVPLYNYQIHREKLFREISKAYLMALSSRTVFELVETNRKLLEKNNFSELQTTHVILCLSKATFSTWASEGHANLIKACGGHGFSQYSGLPSILTEEFINQIAEGDNSVLLLQVARQLYTKFNYLKQGMMGKLIGPFKFMQEHDMWMYFKPELTDDHDFNIDQLLRLLYRATCFMLQKSSLKAIRLIQKNKDFLNVMNEQMGNDNLNLAKLFSATFVIESAISHLKEIDNKTLRLAIIKLIELGAINLIEEFAYFMIESDCLTSAQTIDLHRRRDRLLVDLKDDGLVLAEGMQWQDAHLASAIGSQDKDPYDEMFKWVKQYGTLNKFENQIHPSTIQNQVKLARERSNQKL